MYPVTEKDFPGFRFYTDVEKLEGYQENVTALFSIKDEEKNDLYLQVLIPGIVGRTYYKAKSPKTKTAGRVYNGKPLPLFTIRTETEAATKPFITVLEPYKGTGNNSVEKVEVEKRNDGDKFTALKIFNRNKSQQFIFQAIDNLAIFKGEKWEFSGSYGVAGFKNDKINSLYLGKGSLISHSGYSLKSKGKIGSASLSIEGKVLKVSCNQPVEVGIPEKGVKNISVRVGDKGNKLITVQSGKQVVFELPVGKDSEILVD